MYSAKFNQNWQKLAELWLKTYAHIWTRGPTLSHTLLGNIVECYIMTAKIMSEFLEICPFFGFIYFERHLPGFFLNSEKPLRYFPVIIIPSKVTLPIIIV